MTATKLPSGKWRVLIYVGTKENGKRKYESIMGETEAEALHNAEIFKRTRRKGCSKDNSMTLREAFVNYANDKEAVLSPTTIKEYKRMSKQCLTDIMDIKLSQLTQQQIQKAINEEAKTHSPKTVRNINGNLSAVLSYYVPEFKATLRITLPQKTKYRAYKPTNDDVMKILEVTKGCEMEKAIMLAAFGSLRRGEIMALELGDIQGNIITISKSKARTEKGEWIEKAPKTTGSERQITLPDFVIETLKRGVVVPSDKIIGLSPNSITNNFHRITKKAGVHPFRFHDLRHYQASILHSIGIPDKYIMARGGWETNDTLKNIYQGTMEDKRMETEKTICDYFTNIYYNHK